MTGLLYTPQYMSPALDADGDPIAGARLYAYANGTTTPQATYVDAGLTTPQPHPVVADAGGVFPLVYAPDASTYSVAITDGNGAPLAAYDGVNTSTNATTANAALAQGASQSAQTALTQFLAVVSSIGGAGALFGKANANLSNTVLVGTPQTYTVATDLSGAPMLVIPGGQLVANGCVVKLPFAFDAPKTLCLVAESGGSFTFAACPKGGVHPEWWGLQGVLPGLGPQPAAQQSINVAALTAASASIPKGAVRLPSLDVYFNATVGVCQSSQVQVLGEGDNCTRLFWTSAQVAKLAIGSGSPTSFVNECRLADFSTFRTVAPSAGNSEVAALGLVSNTTLSATNTTPLSFAALQGHAIGCIAYGLANLTVENVRMNDDLVGWYWTYTTGVRGREAWAVSSMPNPGAAFYGHYFDGRGTPVAGTSMNGSWSIYHPLVVVSGSGANGYGFTLDGRTSTAAAYGDVRDWSPATPEADNCYIGLLICCNGTSGDTDIKPSYATLDSCSGFCALIYGASAQAGIQIRDAEFIGAAGCGQLILAQNCNGSVTVGGEFDGGAAYATCTGIYVNDDIDFHLDDGSSFVNLTSSVQIASSASFYIGSATHENIVGQGTTGNRVEVQASSKSGFIAQQFMGGQAGAGLAIDSGATGIKYFTPILVSGSTYTNGAVAPATPATGNTNLG